MFRLKNNFEGSEYKKLKEVLLANSSLALNQQKEIWKSQKRNLLMSA